MSYYICDTSGPASLQDGAYFGAIKCSREYLGNSLPALVTNLKEAHPAVREYMLTIVRERLESAPTALSHAADTFYDDKRLNGEQKQEKRQDKKSYKKKGKDNQKNKK